MNVYKVELMIIDFDDLGEEAIKETIENQKYPNYCISPDVKKIDVRSIGDWSDGHPLNRRDQCDAAYAALFERGAA